MGKLLAEIDDALLAKLDTIGPSRSDQRDEFVSSALKRALWDLEERKIAEAYARQPDSEEEAYFDPEVWES